MWPSVNGNVLTNQIDIRSAKTHEMTRCKQALSFAGVDYEVFVFMQAVWHGWRCLWWSSCSSWPEVWSTSFLWWRPPSPVNGWPMLSVRRAFTKLTSSSTVTRTWTRTSSRTARWPPTWCVTPKRATTGRPDAGQHHGGGRGDAHQRHRLQRLPCGRLPRVREAHWLRAETRPHPGHQ